MQLNPHYARAERELSFSTIAHKVADYQKAHPEADVIRLGIGDVTLPLAASVTEAMHKAVEEQGHKGTFHGYIPSEQGYEFLRDAIHAAISEGHGVELDMSKFHLRRCQKRPGQPAGPVQSGNTILVPDPVLPGLRGRQRDGGPQDFSTCPPRRRTASCRCRTRPPRGHRLHLQPQQPHRRDLSVEQLKAWVAWAKANDAVILFDAAYESALSPSRVSPAASEVEARRSCHPRCAASPRSQAHRHALRLHRRAGAGRGKLNKMWLRRQTTKFNGVAYFVQRGAEAVFTERA